MVFCRVDLRSRHAGRHGHPFHHYGPLPRCRPQAREWLATGTSKAKVAHEFGISRQTLYQYLQGGGDAP
ncbi:MAG: helix-turn-helix domain-containing protein [Rhodopila sp.]